MKKVLVFAAILFVRENRVGNFGRSLNDERLFEIILNWGQHTFDDFFLFKAVHAILLCGAESFR